MSRYYDKGVARHMYRGLDERGDHDLKVSLGMRELAEKVCDLNHGVHRLLSHIVDVRREKLTKTIEVYRERGDHDVAEHAEKHGDPLIDAIARLLDEGES